MLVKIFYDDSNLVDVISVPNHIENLQKLQNEFLQWIFNKDIDHGYWVVIDGEKVGCAYGTDEFVEWINSTLPDNICERAEILKGNETECDQAEIELHF